MTRDPRDPQPAPEPAPSETPKRTFDEIPDFDSDPDPFNSKESA